MANLSLVTLPIGNIADLSPRCREKINQSSTVLCEDTRNFRNFCTHAGIDLSQKKLISFHDHSNQKIEQLLELLNKGENLTLVSDAGSPIISDPAFPLVRAVLEDGEHLLESFPGVSSVVIALELSGLPPHPFTFHGFFPREEGKKRSFIEGLNKGTHLFFESPHRARKSVELISSICSAGQLSICRELTKKFESVYRLELSEPVQEQLEEVTFMGEIVLVLYIPDDKENEVKGIDELKSMAKSYLQEGGSPKKLAKILGGLTGISSKEAYNLLSNKRD